MNVRWLRFRGEPEKLPEKMDSVPINVFFFLRSISSRVFFNFQNIYGLVPLIGVCVCVLYTLYIKEKQWNTRNLLSIG